MSKNFDDTKEYETLMHINLVEELNNVSYKEETFKEKPKTDFVRDTAEVPIVVPSKKLDQSAKVNIIVVGLTIISIIAIVLLIILIFKK